MPTPYPRLPMAPTAPPAMRNLPLFGLTVLAVEDSRFASEALRLMCQRTGARLRRAETLALARQHLRVYLPDVVIVDLGLPDGRGEGLISEIALSQRRPSLLLGTSGEVTGAEAAGEAGADGFLEKPIAALSVFMAALQPVLRQPMAALGEPVVRPDPLALEDDLRHAAALIEGAPDARARRYLRGFLGGVARHAADPALAEAARGAEGAVGMDRLARLLSQRIDAARSCSGLHGRG